MSQFDDDALPAKTDGRASTHPGGLAEVDAIRVNANVVVLRAQGGDPGAPFEADALASLRTLKPQNAADWMRVREQLKRCSVPVSELDKHVHF